MKYSLRSLMVVVLVAPPLLAGGYAVLREIGDDSMKSLCYQGVFVIFLVVSGALYLDRNLNRDR